MVVNVTPVRSPARAEIDILGTILGGFWPMQATFLVGGGQLRDIAIPFRALIFYLLRVVYQNWLVADVTSVGSPASRVQHIGGAGASP